MLLEKEQQKLEEQNLKIDIFLTKSNHIHLSTSLSKNQAKCAKKMTHNEKKGRDLLHCLIIYTS